MLVSFKSMHKISNLLVKMQFQYMFFYKHGVFQSFEFEEGIKMKKILKFEPSRLLISLI